MKRSVSDRMKVYLERAEQLKPFVQRNAAANNVVAPSATSGIPTFNQLSLQSGMGMAPSLSQLQLPPVMSNEGRKKLHKALL
jgi:hypothetical protein